MTASEDLHPAGTKSVLARRFDTVTLVLLVAIALFGAYSMYVPFSKYIFEDAYITYQYSSNFAAGKGLVFNEGERVLGTSTPLYAVLLGCLGWLGIDIPTVSDVIYVGSLAAVGIMGGLVLRSQGSPVLALLFALIVGAGGPGMQRYMGMESALLSALLFGVFMAARSRRDTLAAVLVALAFLTRYDAAIFAIVYFGFVTVRDRRIPWKHGLLAVICILPWLIFAQVYYGSVFPHTLGAKAGDTSFGEYIGETQRRQLKFLWHFAASAGLSVKWAPVVRWILIIGFWSGATLGARKWPMATLLWVAPFATLAGYAAIGPHLDFAWYHAPGMLMLVLLICLGLGSLAQLLRVRWLLSLIVAGLVAVSVPALPKHFRVHYEQHLRIPTYQTRIFGYQRMADFLVAAELTHLRLLTYEPGYLCYRSKNPAIDGAGLITKGPKWHGPVEERPTFAQLIEQYDPDLIVVFVDGDHPGYQPIGPGAVKFELRMKRSVYEANLDAVLRGLRAVGAEEPLEIATPFSYDDLGGEAGEMRWILDGGIGGHRGDPHQMQFPGRVAGSPSLNVAPFDCCAESPSFLVDCDRVDFEFAALDAPHAGVQLVLDNTVVASLGGSFDPEHPAAIPGSFDLGPWRGKRARLRFVLQTPATGPMAFNDVSSANDSSRSVLDDFGSTRREGLWAEVFDTRSTQRDLALVYGPAMMANQGIAHSHGIHGRAQQVSQPFVLTEDELRFLFYDFAPELSYVELVVEGEVVHRIDARNWQQIRSVAWDVASHRGQTAVLRVVDGDPAPDAWVGIDELVLATR